MSTTHSPEIIALRQEIEQNLGFTLQSPSDFQQLIRAIWVQQHTMLSLSTIKRLWGYVESTAQPRISTLNTLSQYLGYADWNAYLAALDQRSGVESDLFNGDGVYAKELQIGDKVEVCWLPNRTCIFCYLGDNHFVVESSKNAKLQTGNTFDAFAFVIGKPMYLDNIHLTDGSITSYVAGKNNGITSVRKL